MSNLREIKGKIKGVAKTRQVTRAMEAVSASKMRKSQEKAIAGRPYAISAFRILHGLSKNLNTRESFFVKERPTKKVLIILITSDRGFAGGLNSAVIKKTSTFMSDKKIAKEDVSFICVGKKGYDFFSKRGYAINENFEKSEDVLPISEVEEISARAVNLYKEGIFDHVFVAYNNFISTFSQEPLLHQALPLREAEIGQIIKYIAPTRGKYSEIFKSHDVLEEKVFSDYLFEPSAESVFERLIFDLISVLIFQSFMEGKASEFSARMVAMRSASDKALEMGNALTLSYNKARQSVITREVSEIVGGVEALA